MRTGHFMLVGVFTPQCYVLRTKATMNLTPPLWQLFMEDGNRFLMAAKNRIKSKTSNYLLSMEARASDRKSPLLVGKLRSNWVRVPIFPAAALQIRLNREASEV
jgi:hypothetical protein